MRKRQTALLGLTAMLIALALATGCAGNNQADADPFAGSGNSGITDADTVQQEQEQEQEESDPDAAEELTNEPDGQAEDSGEVQEEPVAKAYYMNKNYFIKPIDEQADKKVVLLTFDDGPKELELLTSLLDTLDKHEAKAIFFVNGYRVKQNPDLLQLIAERGQIVGNHSWDHIDLKKQTQEKIDEQIGLVQSEVEALIGEAPQFFRPPFGSGNDYVRAKVQEQGMLYMTWSNGSLDWADNQNNPDGVIASVMEQLNPGSNILMHELSWTAEALDRLLAQITEAGYTFVDPRAIELEAR